MKQSRVKQVIKLAGLASLLASSTGQAAKHDHKEAANLLPECQGPAALPSVHCGQAPTPAFEPDGKLWLAFAQNGHVYVTTSTDLGKSFTAPTVVNTTPERVSSDGENRPKISIGATGEIYLSWTKKIEGRYAGDVRFARSTNHGKSYDKPLTVNDDRAPISHRFDSMVVNNKGDITISWIDKRDLARAKKRGAPYPGAAIYYAQSNDSGESFEANRKLADHSCECCRLALDVDSQDEVIALWRHVFPTNLRDHAIARLDGTTSPIQGTPTRATDDGWIMEGCPHHGPDLATDDKQKVHLAWFTQGTKNKGLMYGRFDLSSQQLETQHNIDDRAGAARPQVLNIGNNRLIVAWKAYNGKSTDLLVRYSSNNGDNWSSPQTLVSTASGSDHPILIAHKNKPYISWHTLAEGYQLIPVPFIGNDSSHAH